MGRTQGFETAVVIAAARDLFWQRGFEATSVTEVERATGVGRSSLYHAFGSMRGLFDAAVQDYLNSVIRPRLIPLTAEHVAPDALVTYLVGLADGIRSVDRADLPPGCLLLGSATTMCGDTAVHEVITTYLDEVRLALRRGVAAQNPARTDDEVNHLATVVFGSVVAGLSLARLDAEGAAAVVDAARVVVTGGALPRPEPERRVARLLKQQSSM
ncbi:TetR/AcrR family transcriptional regulator [Williamsia sterculiae]|uniref:Transcriptional regulator, TetR family n=1 Tax=Williamsia sterculiae TaxID=1344003 RepID=A0A1N7HAN0_9NOCA|nr:TetR/AcrR family transcriptional regulator [Williamsia sterculiae]SIS21935.1 transcriptional regulator, TetR family [Williamsia sterculiae]